VRLDSPLRALYEAPLALIRPDQVVAWRGATAASARGVLAIATGRGGGPPPGPTG
jgi:hypothetical protein